MSVRKLPARRHDRTGAEWRVSEAGLGLENNLRFCRRFILSGGKWDMRSIVKTPQKCTKVTRLVPFSQGATDWEERRQ